MKRHAIDVRCWSILALALCVGCASRGLEPAEGTVTLDGKPLEGVHVNFFPAGADINNPTVYRGLTDAAGHYVLHRANDGSAGVAPGKYRVILSTAVAGPNDDETTPLPRERIPAKHRETTFEIPDGGTKDAKFELKSQ